MKSRNLSKEELQNILKYFPGSFVLMEIDFPKFTIVEASDLYLKNTNQTREGLLGLGLFEAFPADPEEPESSGINIVMESLKKAIKEKKADKLEVVKYNIPNPARGKFEERYWRPIHQPIFNKNGDVEFIMQFVEDVTELIRAKKSEKKVKEEFKKEQIKSYAIIQKHKFYFDELFNAAPFSIVMHDLEDRIIKINNCFKKLFKYSEEEIIGKKIRLLVPEDKMEEYNGLHEQLEKQSVVQIETIRKSKDNSLIDVLLVRYPLISNNQLIGYYSLYLDITEHKKTERKLAENEEKTRKIIDAALDAVVSMDVDGIVTAWNYQAEKTFGFMKDEAIGNLFCELILLPEQREKFNKELALSLTNEKTSFINKRIEIMAINKNMEEIPVELAVLPVKYADKYFFTAFIRDITEQKEWQQQLIDYNRNLEKANAELDRFVYSVSHDLRAPLTNIVGLLYILDNVPEQKRGEIVEKIKHTINRLDVLIKTILEYSRNSRLKIKPSLINLKSLIENCWEHYSYIKGAENIKLKVEIAEHSPFVSDKDRIYVIFNNLISNAVKYIDPNKENPYVNVHVEINKEMAIIKFEDNGIGIERDYVEEIFDMFFRGTEISEGSGLGLYIVKEVVNYLKGTIKVESKPGEGTTFYIELPNLISESEQWENGKQFTA